MLMYAKCCAYFCVIGLAASCSAPSGQAPLQSTTETDVAQTVLSVGQHTFTQGDIAIRSRIIQQKYPDQPKLEMYATAQLIQGALYQTALETLGAPITENDLNNELDRIEHATQNREGLKRLQSMCGGVDSKKYGRIGVLPDFANRRFHFQVVPNDKTLQMAQEKVAEQALSQVMAGVGNLKTWVKNSGAFSYRTRFFSRDHGFFEAEFEKDVQPPWQNMTLFNAEISGKDLIARTVAVGLAEGEVFGTLIETDRAFEILRAQRWLDSQKGIREFESVVLPKRQSHDIFWDVARGVPVNIRSPELVADLQANVNWMALLNVGALQ